MLLRRITQHVDNQNWLAVGLDFVIVVVGVFIGIQVSNWNEAGSAARHYDLAVDRYRAEIEANLETLDTLDTEMVSLLSQVSTAFNALMSRDDSQETRETVELGLNRIVGTYGLKLRTSALRDLTETPPLLAQQSQAERQAFANSRHRMDIFLREAEFIELIPLEEPVQNNPIIQVGSLGRADVQYSGVDYSRPVRRLTINVPINVACKDNMLIKSFYTWERWQGTMPAVVRILREDLEAAKQRLGE